MAQDLLDENAPRDRRRRNGMDPAIAVEKSQQGFYFSH
jgi:hypothetical protein